MGSLGGGYPGPSVSHGLLKNVLFKKMTNELTNRNRLTDIENERVVTRGEMGW